MTSIFGTESSTFSEETGTARAFPYKVISLAVTCAVLLQSDRNESDKPRVSRKTKERKIEQIIQDV